MEAGNGPHPRVGRRQAEPRVKTVLQVVYEPRGRAAEYAPLAVNLYDGCPHGCTYCYVPACLRRSRLEFHEAALPRRGVLDKLADDCRLLASRVDRREILLCFSCDPYPFDWPTDTTRQALEMIGRAGLRATVLTKNGPAAVRDFDLFCKYGFRFGTSLSFMDDAAAWVFEPLAPAPSARIGALSLARKEGIQTWISVEPVVDPNQAMEVFVALRGQGHEWKVGKWNHDARAAAIDWKEFLAAARYALAGEKFVFKKDLLEAAGEGESHE